MGEGALEQGDVPDFVAELFGNEFGNCNAHWGSPV